jgi:hypothetical protein
MASPDGFSVMSSAPDDPLRLYGFDDYNRVEFTRRPTVGERGHSSRARQCIGRRDLGTVSRSVGDRTLPLDAAPMPTPWTSADRLTVD